MYLSWNICKIWHVSLLKTWQIRVCEWSSNQQITLSTVVQNTKIWAGWKRKNVLITFISPMENFLLCHCIGQVEAQTLRTTVISIHSIFHYIRYTFILAHNQIKHWTLHFFELLCSVFRAADKTAGGVALHICNWGGLTGLGGLPGEAGELGSLSRKLPLVLSMLIYLHR